MPSCETCGNSGFVGEHNYSGVCPDCGGQSVHFSPEKEGAELVKDGWMQTSRKYRMVARIPKGLTGLQALRECDPKAARDLEERIERWAADSFRRSHICKTFFPECFKELDIETFAAFRKAGGEMSH